jgi:hypothetical protein
MKGLSRESRMLIDAARDGDDPSAADRKRVRAALARKIAVGAVAGAVAVTATHGAAGAVATAATSSGTGLAAAGAGAGTVGAAAAGAGGASIAAGVVTAGFGAKLLVTVAIVGAVGAGSVGYARHESAKRAGTEARVATLDPSAAQRAPVSPLASPPVASPAREPDPAADTPAPPVLATPSPVSKPLDAPLAPSRLPQAATAPSDLDVEIALLADVNVALRAKDAALALRILDERARRFPNGALAEESEAARVFALCEIGRADEARDVAGRFLREHPRSPLAPRVSRACDEPSTF